MSRRARRRAETRALRIEDALHYGPDYAAWGGECGPNCACCNWTEQPAGPTEMPPIGDGRYWVRRDQRRAASYNAALRRRAAIAPPPAETAGSTGKEK